MQSTVSADVVAEIVESIFTTMLNLSISPVEEAWRPTEDRLTSSVFLEGDWNGAVSLECSRRQACLFAGHLLSMQPPETVDDDVRDALGELANMIGGNIKSLIAGEIRLSMPSVIDGHDYGVRICGSEIENRIGFRFESETLWITVLGGAPNKEAVAIHNMGHRDIA